MAFNSIKVLDHASYGMNIGTTTIVILVALDLFVILPLNILYATKFFITLSGYYDEGYVIAFLIMSAISLLAGFIALYDFCNGAFF
jgi:Na+/phosphate symporter